MLDSTTKTTTTKAASSPKTDPMQAFRATAEATDMIKSSFSTAVKGAQDYNAKVIEFVQTNTKTTVDFVQKLSAVKSPSEFIELSTDHSRTQFETLTEQTKELAALAQKVTLANVEPLKAGVTKAFSQST